MPILPEVWLAAQTSIAAAIKKPYLSTEEVSVGQRYSAELDDSIRRFGVGADYFHASADPGLPASNQITTAAQARDFVNSVRMPLNQHFASYAAHWRPTARVVANDPDFYVLANAIKAALAAHRVDPSVHFNDDTNNVVTAANATDDASLVTLAEALRIATAGHVSSAGKIVFTQTTPDVGSYHQALAAFNAQQAKLLAIIAYAERVARAAQVSLGFTLSNGLPHENTPYGVLPATFVNARKIQDRLDNIREVNSTDAYVLDVVSLAAVRIAGLSAGTPPSPPGQSTLVVVGTISTAAETALNAAIAKCNRFANAASVQ